MADNTDLNGGAGGDTIRTIELASGAKVQTVRHDFGVGNSEALASGAMPVKNEAGGTVAVSGTVGVGTSVLPTGAATEATSAASAASLASIDGKTVDLSSSINSRGRLLVDMPDRIGAFGELMTAELTPQIQLDFPYDINDRIVVEDMAGTGAVSVLNSMAALSTGVTPGSIAGLYSRRLARYAPGQGLTIRFTCVFSTGSAGTKQVIGFGDTNDGFFVGYEGEDFGVFHRNAGVETFIALASWNVQVPAGFDPTTGNVYQMRVQWLGFGEVRWYLEIQSLGEFDMVHRLQYANTFAVPSMSNPSLPFTIQAENGATANDVEMSTASVGIFTEGRRLILGPLFSIGSFRTGVGTTPKNIITIRNRATFHGVTNRVPVRIMFSTFATDGTKTARVQWLLGATLTTPVWTDLDTARSVIEYDVSDTLTSPSGTVLGTRFLAAGDAGERDFTGMSFMLYPGEAITMAGNANSGTSEISAGLAWREDQ